MKCIINCSSSENLWIKDFFPSVQPYLLKILNKTLIEYYIDFCVLLGISEIKIVSDSSDKELQEYLSDGTQWGVEISYSLSKNEDSLKNIISKNMGFVNDEKLLLLNGYIFISYNKKKKDYELLNLKNNTSIFANEKGGAFFLSDFKKS